MKIAAKILALSFVCGVYTACGGSSEIAGDRDPLVTRDGGSGGAATVTNDGSGGSATVAADPIPDTPACKQGFAQNNAGKKCDFVVKAVCFDDSTVACECAGCAVDKCLILESYPAQIHCEK